MNGHKRLNYMHSGKKKAAEKKEKAAAQKKKSGVNGEKQGSSDTGKDLP